MHTFQPNHSPGPEHRHRQNCFSLNWKTSQIPEGVEVCSMTLKRFPCLCDLTLVFDLQSCYPHKVYGIPWGLVTVPGTCLKCKGQNKFWAPQHRAIDTLRWEEYFPEKVMACEAQLREKNTIPASLLCPRVNLLAQYPRIFPSSWFVLNDWKQFLVGASTNKHHETDRLRRQTGSRFKSPHFDLTWRKKHY